MHSHGDHGNEENVPVASSRSHDFVGMYILDLYSFPQECGNEEKFNIVCVIIQPL